MLQLFHVRILNSSHNQARDATVCKVNIYKEEGQTFFLLISEHIFNMADYSKLNLDVSARLKHIENEPPYSQIRYRHARLICTNIVFRIHIVPIERNQTASQCDCCIT